MDQAKIEDCSIEQAQFDSLLGAERQLKRRDFINVRFTNSCIEGGEFSNLVFYGCDFHQIELQALSLRNCRFWNCHFERVQLTELQIENCEFLNCQIHSCLIQSSQICDCSFFQVKSDAIVEQNTLLGLNLLECDFAELKLAENQSMKLMIDQATRLAPSIEAVRHPRPIEGYEQSFKIAIIGAPLTASKTFCLVQAAPVAFDKLNQRSCYTKSACLLSIWPSAERNVTIFVV